MTANQVVAFENQGGLMALLESVADIADELGHELGAQSGSYLKFSGKTGQYTFNGQEVEHGTTLAFNMLETEKGAVCYVDNTAAERMSFKVFGPDKVPSDAELQEIYDTSRVRKGEGWKKSMSFHVKFLDNGQQATLSFSSGGGVRAAVKLFQNWAVEQRMKVDASGAPLIPLVEIGAEEKQLKDQVGSYFVPTLQIVEWMTSDDLVAEFGGGAAAPKVAAKPAPAPAKPAAAARTGLGSGVRGRRA